MQRKKHILLKIMLIFIASSIIIGIVFIIYVKFGLSHEIDLSLIQPGKTTVTKIYTFDRNDGMIDASSASELTDERIFLENSEWCSYYDMPSNLKNAFIAVEDHKFYEHNGVNWLRTAQATLNYIFNFGKASFGGSTITQQLVKNLTGDDMITPKRKLEEIIRAQNLEKKMSKNEILELYLNVVYLSENCYGVQSASRVYFGKDASELTLAECASLASIVKSPTKYDPYVYPENNKARREIVLSQMLEQNMISDAEYEEAVNEAITINSNIDEEKTSGVYSWFTEKLINDVSKDLMDKYNLSKEGALMMINKGGLRIYSTMDKMAQEAVDKVFEGYIAYLKPQNGKYPEAACVVLDPYTSDILAISGGVGVKSANRIFNRATDAKRALGSVIKPLSVYAPAIEYREITYGTAFDDVPTIKNGELWPHNSTHIYKGLVSVNYALERSLNTVSVRVLNKVGIERAFDFCKNKFNLNLNEKSDRNEAPLALGQLTDGETLLNTANAYCCFANGGTLSKPRSYLYVTDSDGEILLSNEYEGKRVISEDTAALMNIMLRNVVKNGTAKYLNLKNEFEVAGKTGTSGDNFDKWFIGYTPYYTCGVWVGYDTPSAVNSSNSPALLLFDAVMARTHSDKDREATLFSTSNIVTAEFCVDSGCAPSDECKLDPRLDRVQTGYFIKGTEPSRICDMHKEIYIDSSSGKIADESTHPLFKRKISLVDYMRDPIYDKLDVNDMKYLLSSRM